MNMENERKKAWLMRYNSAVDRLNQAETELRNARTIGARAIVYDDMPHGSPELHGLETYAIQLEQKIDACNRAESDAHRIHDEVLAAINRLPRPQRDVMFYRYVCFEQTRTEHKAGLYGSRQLSWQEIADTMAYSLDRVAHIHGEALARLEIPQVDRQ